MQSASPGREPLGAELPEQPAGLVAYGDGQRRSQRCGRVEAPGRWRIASARDVGRCLTPVGVTPEWWPPRGMTSSMSTSTAERFKRSAGEAG